MIDNSLKSRLENQAEVTVHQNISLSDYTSFKIGGPAAFLVKPDTTKKIASILSVAHKYAVPTLVLGGGTNLLVSDEGFEGLVIAPCLKSIVIDKENDAVEVGASVGSSELALHLIKNALAGLEFAAGLPGTVGGAVAGNAGCFGGSFGDVLASATVVLSDGQILKVDKRDWFEFGYRHSCLSKIKAVVTSLKFNITDGSQELLNKVAADHLALRAERHPHKRVKTAGSYFKNLPPLLPGQRRRAAGALLDQVGAKSMHVGDAAVFEKHANIVVNMANASAKDVLKLTWNMAKLVKDRFNTVLVPEVRFIGNPPM